MMTINIFQDLFNLGPVSRGSKAVLSQFFRCIFNPNQGYLNSARRISYLDFFTEDPQDRELARAQQKNTKKRRKENVLPGMATTTSAVSNVAF